LGISTIPSSAVMLGLSETMTVDGRIYLDWNATTPLRPAARAAMLAAMDTIGNPSSVHADGRQARAVIERAREEVAALVGARPRNVIFTGSGTEAAATVLSPCLGATGHTTGPSRLLVSAVEHACVLAGGSCAADEVRQVPVDGDGRIDLASLESELESAKQAGSRVLLSLQVANNETGVMQPLAEAAALVHRSGGLVHSDAVQAAGKTPLDIDALGADVITIAAHKFGGPKGVAAIVFRDEAIRLGRPLLRGGGQERGQRAGTENVIGIAGMGAAAREAAAGLAEMGRIETLRDKLQTEILSRAPQAVVFSAAAPRLPNTLCFALPGLAAETALIGFDMDGVSLSSGSACSSGKVKPSHVLDAMGVSADLSRSALRLSLGWSSTDEDGARFLRALENRLKSLHKRRADNPVDRAA